MFDRNSKTHSKYVALENAKLIFVKNNDCFEFWATICDGVAQVRPRWVFQLFFKNGQTRVLKSNSAAVRPLYANTPAVALSVAAELGVSHLTLEIPTPRKAELLPGGET